MKCKNTTEDKKLKSLQYINKKLMLKPNIQTKQQQEKKLNELFHSDCGDLFF